MAEKRSSKRRLWIPLGLVALVAAGGGLYWVRKEANGFRNAFSVNYWVQRRKGQDLYRPANAYFLRARRDLAEVCLTIDDGPHPESLPLILETLRAHNVHATFFVVGKNVKLHPDLVRAALADGDEVGNHTQDHYRLDTLRPEQIRNEITNCEINVERASGRRMTLLRPPGMRSNHEAANVIKSLGYTTIGWTVGAKDFIPTIKKGQKISAEMELALHTTPAQVVERVMRNVQNGSIILLHDDPITAQALPALLDQLQEHGYAVKTAGECLAHLPTPVLVVANPPALRTRLAAIQPSKGSTSGSATN